MMTCRLLLLILLLTTHFASQAELYKWIGPDGKVNYSDTPPPKSATHVEAKSFSTSDNVALPYELAHAVDTMPVTLYTGDGCAPCADGRGFLKQHGIPFSEKTISTNEDLNRFKEIAGSTQLPALFIGHTLLHGFSAADWHSNLTLAGYPNSNKLPTNYHFSTPQPLVPPANTAKQKEVKTSPNQPELPARDPNGFHF